MEMYKLKKIDELEEKELLTESERDELRDLKLERSKEEFNEESNWYNPEDYGMCISRWGWM